MSSVLALRVRGWAQGKGLCGPTPFLGGPQLRLQDAWPHQNCPTRWGQLAGKDGTKTHRLTWVIITANRHIFSPRQVWSWQPLITAHPQTSAHPAVFLCSAWNPAFWWAGPVAAWAVVPIGWKVISFLQNGSSLCCPEKVWGAGIWALPCSLGLAEELLVVQANPRAFPRWAAGLEQRIPASCCSHPAWCQLLQRAGTTCFHVNCSS